MYFLLLACSSDPTPSETNATGAARAGRPEQARIERVSNEKPTSVADLPVVVSASGLKSWVLKAGDGATPAPGQDVGVHYTGWLKSDGSKFDSSLDRGDLLHFAVGTGGVIRGWDEGVSLMKVGERRQFEIPPELAYGDRGAGGVIPPGATLLFDVELVELGS